MNILRIGRNITIVAILLSLLFHGFTILYIFMQKKARALNNTTQQFEDQEQLSLLPPQQQPQQNPWAETKGRAGNFGAPIFFQDDPYFASTSPGGYEEHSEATKDKPDFASTSPGGHEEHGEASSSAKTSSSAKATEDKTEDKSDDESIEGKTMETFASDMASISEDTTQAEQEAEENDLTQEDQTAQENNSTQDNLEDNVIDFNAEMSPQTAQPTQQQSRPTSSKKTTTGKKRTRKKRTNKTNNSFGFTGPKKPPLSLAQLTQGFLNRLNEGGGMHAVSMIGKKGGIPTEEQLKYERYFQKLEWCLQNSLRINRDRTPPVSQDATVYIRIILNRDGTPRQLFVAQSSGNILLDKFILFAFQDASSSFPPVPSYLKDDPLAITCLVPCSRKIQFQ